MDKNKTELEKRFFELTQIAQDRFLENSDFNPQDWLEGSELVEYNKLLNEVYGTIGGYDNE